METKRFKTRARDFVKILNILKADREIILTTRHYHKNLFFFHNHIVVSLNYIIFGWNGLVFVNSYDCTLLRSWESRRAISKMHVYISRRGHSIFYDLPCKTGCENTSYKNITSQKKTDWTAQSDPYILFSFQNPSLISGIITNRSPCSFT